MMQLDDDSDLEELQSDQCGMADGYVVDDVQPIEQLR